LETFSVLFDERRPVNGSKKCGRFPLPSRGERNEATWLLSAATELHCGCAEHITPAERELAAFVGVMTELFGTEQGELSAKDWLHEIHRDQFAFVHARVATDYCEGFDSARQPSERFVSWN